MFLPFLNVDKDTDSIGKRPILSIFSFLKESNKVVLTNTIPKSFNIDSSVEDEDDFNSYLYTQYFNIRNLLEMCDSKEYINVLKARTFKDLTNTLIKFYLKPVSLVNRGTLPLDFSKEQLKVIEKLENITSYEEFNSFCSSIDDKTSSILEEIAIKVYKSYLD